MTVMGIRLTQFAIRPGITLVMAVLVSVILAGSSSGLELAIVAIAVALAGLPHGAADAWIATRQGLSRGPIRTAAFLTVYIVLAVLVVLAWHVAAFASLVGFLAASAWHFGDDARDAHHPVARISTGLIILGAPAVFHPGAVGGTYVALTSSETITSTMPAVTQLVAAQGLLFWAASLVLPLTLLLTCNRSKKNSGARISALKHLSEMIVVIAMAAWLSPLLYFAVYFCVIHSPRHLLRVVGLFPEQRGKGFTVSVGLLTLLSVLAALAAWGWLSFTGLQPDVAGLKVLFIGLAALTLPHMVLVDGFSAAAFQGGKK